MTKWSLSKPKRQRRRNGTNKRSNDPEQWHVRYKSWYISWSFRVLCKQRSQNLRHVSQFLNLLFELNPALYIHFSDSSNSNRNWVPLEYREILR